MHIRGQGIEVNECEFKRFGALSRRIVRINAMWPCLVPPENELLANRDDVSSLQLYCDLVLPWIKRCIVGEVSHLIAVIEICFDVFTVTERVIGFAVGMHPHEVEPQ